MQESIIGVMIDGFRRYDKKEGRGSILLGGNQKDFIEKVTLWKW